MCIDQKFIAQTKTVTVRDRHNKLIKPSTGNELAVQTYRNLIKSACKNVCHQSNDMRYLQNKVPIFLKMSKSMISNQTFHGATINTLKQKLSEFNIDQMQKFDFSYRWQ